MRQRFPLLLIGQGERRYGLPFRRIVEVIPRVELGPLDTADDAVDAVAVDAAAGVAGDDGDAGDAGDAGDDGEAQEQPQHLIGELDYRGQPVPVFDLTLLLSGRCSADRMDTRIVVVDVAEQAEQVQLLGLLAERVVDSVVKTPGDFKTSVRASSAPYLGATTRHDGGTVQVVDVAQLLDAEQRARLFDSREDAAPEEES
jgi:chemotaxis-related protein WspB